MCRRRADDRAVALRKDLHLAMQLKRAVDPAAPWCFGMDDERVRATPIPTALVGASAVCVLSLTPGGENYL